MITQIIVSALLVVAAAGIVWLLRPLRNPTYYRCQRCRGWFNELGEWCACLPPGANYDPSPGQTCAECVEARERGEWQ